MTMPTGHTSTTPGGRERPATGVSVLQGILDARSNAAQQVQVDADEKERKGRIRAGDAEFLATDRIHSLLQDLQRRFQEAGVASHLFVEDPQDPQKRHYVDKGYEKEQLVALSERGVRLVFMWDPQRENGNYRSNIGGGTTQTFRWKEFSVGVKRDDRDEITGYLFYPQSDPYSHTEPIGVQAEALDENLINRINFVMEDSARESSHLYFDDNYEMARLDPTSQGMVDLVCTHRAQVKVHSK